MILSWGLYLAWPCYSELGFNISHDFSRPRNDPNTNERWPLQFVRLYSTVFCFVSGMYNKSLIMIPHLSNLFLSYLCFSNKREKYLVLKSPSPYLDAIFTLDMIRALPLILRDEVRTCSLCSVQRTSFRKTAKNNFPRKWNRAIGATSEAMIRSSRPLFFGKPRNMKQWSDLDSSESSDLPIVHRHLCLKTHA